MSGYCDPRGYRSSRVWKVVCATIRAKKIQRELGFHGLQGLKLRGNERGTFAYMRLPL